MMNRSPNRMLFVAGLLFALAAAVLLVLGVIESGPAAAIGILGIGLVATSSRTRPGHD